MKPLLGQIWPVGRQLGNPGLPGKETDNYPFNMFPVDLQFMSLYNSTENA